MRQLSRTTNRFDTQIIGVSPKQILDSLLLYIIPIFNTLVKL